VLGWWRVHGTRYPMVACKDCDVLNVSTSMVASEPAFNVGRILDLFKTSLTPKVIDLIGVFFCVLYDNLITYSSFVNL